MIKRIFACLVALTLLLAAASCKKEESVDYVIKYNNTKITEGMYNYLYASLKHFYLDTYKDIKDSADGWAAKVTDDMSYAEYVDGKIRDTIKVFAISAELYDTYGYVISAEGRDIIAEEIDGAVEYFGGEEKLKEELNGRFGMTVEDLRKVHEIQYKYERLLYDTGKFKADDSAKETYYKDNYILLKIIYIGTKIGYKTDEDGKLILNGNKYESYEYSAEEKAERVAFADGVESKIRAGELSFDDAYTDEKINEFETVNYPNGIYFGRENYLSTGLIDIAEKGFSMEIGGVARLSDENGEFIICRYELGASAYDSGEDYAQFSDMEELCSKSLFDKRMNELMPKAECDQAVIDKYSVTNVVAVSY